MGFKGTGGSIGSSDSSMLPSSQFSEHQQQAKPKLYQNSIDENDNVAIEGNIYQYEKLSTTPQLETIITKQNLDKEVTFISKDNNNLLATVDIATLLCDKLDCRILNSIKKWST